VELRRGQGERPAPEEYLRRFPDQGTAIASAFDTPTEEEEVRSEGDLTRSYHAHAVHAEGQEPTIAARAGKNNKKRERKEEKK